jgi:hypothetical protein
MVGCGLISRFNDLASDALLSFNRLITQSWNLSNAFGDGYRKIAILKKLRIIAR